MPTDLGTVALTLLALVAFASNSILTRLALGARHIDAASFTAARLLSGALALVLMVRAKDGRWSSLRPRGPAGAIILLVYAVPFSFAYIRIGAAVGALVLFGAVQLTMVGYGIVKGERPAFLAWLGLVIALAGLGILSTGSTGRPDPIGVLLMAAAGAAWGAYSIAGRTETDAVASNARNFLWVAPFALLLPLVAPGPVTITARGLLPALVSGAITTACGYVVWYRALRRLAVTAAAVTQLGVPVLAALGAVVVLGEPLNARVVASGVTVLGGIGLVLASRTLSSRHTDERTSS